MHEMEQAADIRTCHEKRLRDARQWQEQSVNAELDADLLLLAAFELRGKGGQDDTRRGYFPVGLNVLPEIPGRFDEETAIGAGVFAGEFKERGDIWRVLEGFFDQWRLMSADGVSTEGCRADAQPGVGEPGDEFLESSDDSRG